MIITSDDYVAYLNRAAAVIRDSKDYISGLDAATGDGDHWANLNLGFEAIILPELPPTRLIISMPICLNTSSIGSFLNFSPARMIASKPRLRFAQ